MNESNRDLNSIETAYHLNITAELTPDEESAILFTALNWIFIRKVKQLKNQLPISAKQPQGILRSSVLIISSVVHLISNLPTNSLHRKQGNHPQITQISQMKKSA
jgi:hypothetical protein